MSRYVSLTTLKSYMGIAGTITDGDDILQLSLDNAESLIDDYCRRSFVGTPGTVYASRFEADRVVGQAFYLRQDLHTLVSLTTGNGWSVPVGSIWLEPREGPPYRVIRLHSQYVYTWNTDQDMVIAGTWGMGTVAPFAIQQATLEYAAYLYRAKDVTPNDQIGFPQADNAQPIGRGMPDGVRWKLSPYRSRTGGMV